MTLIFRRKVALVALETFVGLFMHVFPMDSQFLFVVCHILAVAALDLAGRLMYHLFVNFEGTQYFEGLGTLCALEIAFLRMNYCQVNLHGRGISR